MNRHSYISGGKRKEPDPIEQRRADLQEIYDEVRSINSMQPFIEANQRLHRYVDDWVMDPQRKAEMKDIFEKAIQNECGRAKLLSELENAINSDQGHDVKTYVGPNEPIPL